jgi:hypothetical protein
LGAEFGCLFGEEVGGISGKRLSNFWGREPRTLSEGIGKVEERVKADEGFRDAVERMEKNLIQDRGKKYLLTIAPWFFGAIFAPKNLAFRDVEMLRPLALAGTQVPGSLSIPEV